MGQQLRRVRDNLAPFFCFLLALRYSPYFVFSPLCSLYETIGDMIVAVSHFVYRELLVWVSWTRIWLWLFGPLVRSPFFSVHASRLERCRSARLCLQVLPLYMCS